jgi:hypothetical protein
MGAKSAPAISNDFNSFFRMIKSGGKKCPQNREVGAESASTIVKWGQKAPPLII